MRVRDLGIVLEHEPLQLDELAPEAHVLQRGLLSSRWSSTRFICGPNDQKEA